MNEFESNADAWNRERKFEAWNRECRSSNQVHFLESELEEFEHDSDFWNRKWSSSSIVRGLEFGMEEFDPSSRFEIGNGRVRAKF